MTDGSGQTVYSYIPIAVPPGLGAGQLASIDGPLPNDTIVYGYDQLGRRISTSVNGVPSTRAFDAAGRTINESNLLGAFAYSFDGSSFRIASKSSPNGQMANMVYGNAAHDNTLAAAHAHSGGAAVSEFNYDRDVPARRLFSWSQQAGTTSPSVYTFGYDADNRVTVATVTNAGALVNTFGYSYDPAGNRLTEQIGVTTNSANYNVLNQLTATAGGSGILVSNEWDAEQRLAAVNPRSTDRVCL